MWREMRAWQGAEPAACMFLHTILKMSGDSPLAAYRIDCIGDTDSTGRYQRRRCVKTE
jgi:hypothetical protein